MDKYIAQDSHPVEYFEGEPPCLICGGEGTVDGRDWFDPTYEYEDYNDPFATCPSCHGTGLAKDMTFC